MNAGLVADHVLPRYHALAEATNSLVRGAAAFCDDPVEAALDNLRDVYHVTMDAWMGVQHIRFGPVQYLSRYDRFAFWPDNRNTTGRHLGTLLDSGGAGALEAEAFARGSVAVQGFTALERLLYDADAAAAFAVDNYRCRVVMAITRNLEAMAAGTLHDWRDGESPYGRVVETAGDGNAFYESDKEATLDFFKAFNGSLQFIADLKLGRPLGDDIDSARPRRTESWRSARSLDNVRANLRALHDLYGGAHGFGTVVANNDPDLDATLREGLDSALDAAESIDVPLSAAIADPAKRPQVEDLLTLVRALQELAVTRLNVALGIPVGFNAFDGD